VTTVKVTGKWSRPEFLRAYRFEYRIRRLDIIFLACVLIVGLTYGHLFWILSFGLGLEALLILLLPYVLWMRSRGRDEDRMIVFDDVGFHIVSHTTNFDDVWLNYSKTRERRDYYVLQRTDRRTSAITLKRFFDPVEEMKVRVIFRAHTSAVLDEHTDEVLKEFGKSER
jgi:hypothetical protein